MDDVYSIARIAAAEDYIHTNIYKSYILYFMHYFCRMQSYMQIV